LSLYDSSALKTNNIFKNDKKLNSEEEREDVFKFGMLMLTSAIGSFEVLDLYQSLFENLITLYEDF